MMAAARFWIMLAVLTVSAVGFYIFPHGEKVPVRAPLSSFPSRIGNWRSIEAPMEPRIIRAAGVDDYVSRVYVQDGGLPLSMYVGFYKSQRTGDTIHSPKNCLPGAGWRPVASTSVVLRQPDGRKVPANLYMIEKETDRQMVVYWYQSHGRVVASEYAAKVYLVLDAIRLHRTDGALVRIAVPFEGSSEAAQQRAITFAEELFPALNQILPR